MTAATLERPPVAVLVPGPDNAPPCIGEHPTDGPCKRYALWDAVLHCGVPGHEPVSGGVCGVHMRLALSGVLRDQSGHEVRVAGAMPVRGNVR